MIIVRTVARVSDSWYICYMLVYTRHEYYLVSLDLSPSRPTGKVHQYSNSNYRTQTSTAVMLLIVIEAHTVTPPVYQHTLEMLTLLPITWGTRVTGTYIRVTLHTSRVFGPRDLYPLFCLRHPGDGNLSSPKSRPLGCIPCMFSRKPYVVFKLRISQFVCSHVLIANIRRYSYGALYSLR